MDKPQSLQSIEEFAKNRARALLLRINIIVGVLILCSFGYFVSIYYNSKLGYLTNSLQQTLTQAILRGDRYILNNVAESLAANSDVTGVWIKDSQSGEVIGFYSEKWPSNFLSENPKTLLFSKGSYYLVINRHLASKGFGDLGLLQLAVYFPFWQLVCIAVFLLGIALLLSRYLLRSIEKLAGNVAAPIMKINNLISTGEFCKGATIEPSLDFVETDSVMRSLKEFHSRQTQAETFAREALKDSVKGRIASKVVHDVRQRLNNAFGALQSIKKKLGDRREVESLATALTGIDHIINDIGNVDLRDIGHADNFENLPQSQARALKTAEANHDIHDHLAVALLESVANEFRTRLEAEGRRISIAFSYDNFQTFIKVDGQKFQRVIGNLISNSIKAIDDEGEIKINLKSLPDGFTEVTVSDNGCGFPKDEIAKLGKESFSKFKAGGTGAGLSMVFGNVEHWGGSVAIDTGANKGFKVILRLKSGSASYLYASKIRIPSHRDVVILDDGISSLKQRWLSRLKKVGVAESRVHFFSNPDALSSWMTRDRQHNSIFLFDYYLSEDARDNGVAVAEWLGLPMENVLIVTNNWNDPVTMYECFDAELRIVPKNMIQDIPIEAA